MNVWRGRGVALVDSVYFTQDGVFVMPRGERGFWFSGSAADFVLVLVCHPELSIAGARFVVREVL